MKYRTRKREVKRVFLFGALFSFLMLLVINVLIYALNESLISHGDLLFDFKFFMHVFFSILIFLLSIGWCIDDYKGMRKARAEKLEKLKKKLIKLRTESKIFVSGDGI